MNVAEKNKQTFIYSLENMFFFFFFLLLLFIYPLFES